MTDIAVLTRDLRIHDNPVLSANGADVVPVFVTDPTVERLHHSPNRQAYLAESLRSLDRDLAAMGTRLVHRRGPWTQTVTAIAAEVDAARIHVARDVSGFAGRRLADLREATASGVVTHDSITVIPPDALRPSGSDCYRVFTPYHRRWSDATRRPLLDPPHRIPHHDVTGDPMPETPRAGTSRQRERGGESVARERLAGWLPTATDYGEARDDLAADATSHLSAALHFGVVSPLEVAHAADEVGAGSFLRQLAWRDFNHQLLLARPESSQRDLRAVHGGWRNDPGGLAAWQEGRTGFPIVDAAMRQLTATGWMHNRARMVAASFLTKDLLIDWRTGARWFMQWLTDGDVANNQLGWQWVAGTGTDSNPTRIFNPTRQSERFDPDGTYIRRWVDELADVEGDEIHDPGPLTRSATGYPEPVVDHREAVRTYKQVRGWG
jgi:deoxyribodipyrimidine photo-lyase